MSSPARQLFQSLLDGINRRRSRGLPVRARLHVVNWDAIGRRHARDLDVRSYTPFAPDFIVADYVSRGARVVLRVDRIIEAIDLDTGDILDGEHLRSHLIERWISP